MKTKELNGALVHESVGDAHSHKEWAGWLEANLMAMMADYARELDCSSGYEFSKSMENLALEVWRAANQKPSEPVVKDDLPF